MAKPIITGSTLVFDASKDFNVSFTYTGNTVYGHKIYVYNRNTDELVYQDSEYVMNRILQATIPKDRLTNGSNYYIQIQVIDSLGNESELSNRVLATTHQTPLLTLSVIGGNKTENSSVDVKVTFTQTDDNTDNLKECQFYLYAENGTTVLSTSDKIYPTNNEYTYKFTGLSNETYYNLKVVGQSVAGFIIETELVNIYVSNPHVKAFSSFYAENHNCGIQFESNLIIISQSDTSIEYTIEDSFINLSEQELTYDKNFSIPKNFSLVWNGKLIDKFNGTNDICVLSMGNNEVELHFIVDRVFVASMVNDTKYNHIINIKSYVKFGKELYFSKESVLYKDVNFDNDIFKIFIKRYNGMINIKMKVGN